MFATLPHPQVLQEARAHPTLKIVKHSTELLQSMLANYKKMAFLAQTPHLSIQVCSLRSVSSAQYTSTGTEKYVPAAL